MQTNPMPPPDPARVPDLLDQATAAQERGDQRAVDRATAEVMRNASPAQHFVFLGALEKYPDDIGAVREVMRAAVRINAELPADQRITPPGANAARAAAATAQSTTATPGASPAPGPQAAPAASPTTPTRTHGR